MCAMSVKRVCYPYHQVHQEEQLFTTIIIIFQLTISQRESGGIEKFKHFPIAIILRSLFPSLYSLIISVH